MECPGCGRRLREGGDCCIYSGAPAAVGECAEPPEGSLQAADHDGSNVEFLLEAVIRQSAAKKTRRRKGLGPLGQALVFIAAALAGGFLVWLMR